MKKFLRSLVAMTACAAMVAACNDTTDPKPEPPVEEGQKNYYAFDGGEPVDVKSVSAVEANGVVFVYFSAEEGLASYMEIYNAEDCTEIAFPASAVGSEIDLAALTEADVTYVISMLPQFGEKYGFSIDGYDETISKGVLATSLKNDMLSVKCEFTTLSGIEFIAEVSCPFGKQDAPQPDGNFYEFAGDTVELKSVFAFMEEDGGETYFGFYATPTGGMDSDDIFMASQQLVFMVDGTSMYDDSVYNMESGVSTFDVTNLPAGSELQMVLVNEGEMLASVPDASVTEGTVSVYFTEDADGYVLHATGNIAFNDGNTLKLSVVSPLVMGEGETSYGELEYMVESRGIAESGSFLSGFYQQNTWDDGMTFTYSVSAAPNYLALGGNAFIEIYVGSEDLLNGQAFDVATTNLPFSFKIEYLDRSEGETVPVVIDNNNRAGAAGYITFVENDYGLYDSYFNLTLNNGDITINGYYAGELKRRNVIYTNDEGAIAVLRSATVDLSGSTKYLYLSTQRGTAGPDQYDIKCEVGASEWRYDWLMSFSGQNSAVTWDGVRYDKNSTNSTVIGGNWKVSTPVAIPGGYVAECQTMLFGLGNAYYYGEINLIQ